MKNRYNILTALVTPILLICLLMNVFNITAKATETTESPTATETTESPTATETVPAEPDNHLYQIEFSLYFADNTETEIEPSLEQYQQNQFRCYNAANDEYLIAEYNNDIHAYVFNNKVTTDKTAATIFTIGMSDEHPNKVLIVNVPAGTYYLEQTSVTNTYSALPEAVKLNLNAENPTVNEHPVELANHNLMTFNITLVLEEDVKIMTDLMNGETKIPDNKSNVNPILIVLIIIAIILLALTIYPMFNEHDNTKTKTQSKGNHHGKKK